MSQYEKSCERFPWTVWRLMPSPSMSLEPQSRHAEYADACEAARGAYRVCNRPTQVRHDSSTTVWFSIDDKQEINRNIFSSTGTTLADRRIAELAAQNERLRRALREIADGAPESEPESDYDDMEGAETFGELSQHWRVAVVARAALKGGA